jgi:peptidoglycan/xylan/chitin deacetylase (PgdA/CDA1 family)
MLGVGLATTACAPGRTAPAPAGPAAPGAPAAPNRPGTGPSDYVPNHPPPAPITEPGGAVVLRGGTSASLAARQIALTVDDGFCADCVAGYVAFARRSGIHLTFSPNGRYAQAWAPHAAALRPLIGAGQVQIMNHTFNHPTLTRLPAGTIREELGRNEVWVNRTFETTTLPYYRPPYGRHNVEVDQVAAGEGFNRVVLWDGSYSDSELITPQFLMGQARKYLSPGVIMLGHANHPTVLGLFDQILELIKQRSLTTVTLDELFGTHRPPLPG